MSGVPFYPRLVAWARKWARILPFKVVSIDDQADETLQRLGLVGWEIPEREDGKLHNQELFPEGLVSFVYAATEGRVKGHRAPFIASWCGHESWVPKKDLEHLGQMTTICSDCGLKHFPEHYGLVLQHLEETHEE